MVWRLHCFNAKQTLSREGHGRGPRPFTEPRTLRGVTGSGQAHKATR